MTYYNTNELSGNELGQAIADNLKLEDRILSRFRERKEWQPSELYHYFSMKYPLTSIRRALTDLTTKGKIRKTDKMGRGMYNKNEHVWSI